MKSKEMSINPLLLSLSSKKSLFATTLHEIRHQRVKQVKNGALLFSQEKNCHKKIQTSCSFHKTFLAHFHRKEPFLNHSNTPTMSTLSSNSTRTPLIDTRKRLLASSIGNTPGSARSSDSYGTEPYQNSPRCSSPYTTLRDDDADQSPDSIIIAFPGNQEQSTDKDTEDNDDAKDEATRMLSFADETATLSGDPRKNGRLVPTGETPNVIHVSQQLLPIIFSF